MLCYTILQDKWPEFFPHFALLAIIFSCVCYYMADLMQLYPLILVILKQVNKLIIFLTLLMQVNKNLW